MKGWTMGLVAIFGGGVMGEALLSGLLRSGRLPGDLVVTERRPERAKELQATYGIAVVSNVEAAETADTLIFVVKPQDMGTLCSEITGAMRSGALVVSLAAGITTEFLESALPQGSAVVRVMPNTPALVDQGLAAIAAGAHCDERHLLEAESLLRAVGKVVRVEEKHLDAVTAISGSGPAYVFYVAEAMIEAGVFLGLPRAMASELVVQTFYGAATMLRDTGEHPSVLRENVTSPGGTTVAALRILDDHKVRAAFIAALEAARDRSHELASGQ